MKINILGSHWPGLRSLGGFLLAAMIVGGWLLNRPASSGAQNTEGWEIEVSTSEDHGQEHEQEEQTARSVTVPESAQESLGIETKVLERTDLTVNLPLNGWVRPRPQNRTEIHSPIAGYVMEIHAWPGQELEAGDSLMTLRVPQALDWQQALLDSAITIQSLTERKEFLTAEGKSDLIELLGELESLSAEAAHFMEELEMLRSAGAGAVSRTDLHHKEGEYKATMAKLRAKRGLARAYGLSEDLISQTEEGIERYGDLGGELPPSTNREIQTLETQIRQARVEKESATRNLLSIGFPADPLQKLVAGDAEAMTDTLVLKTRQPGRVMEAPVTAQMSVEPDRLLFGIIDYSTVHVDAEVPEVDIGKVLTRTDLPVPIRALGLGDVRFEGMVEYLDTEIDNERKMAHLVMSVTNTQDRVLRKGMAVSLEFPLSVRHEVIAIPTKAIQRDGVEQVVFVRDGKDPKIFVRRPIRTGERTFEAIEVTEGLHPGEEVVVEGAFPLLLALNDTKGVEGHGHSHN